MHVQESKRWSPELLEAAMATIAERADHDVAFRRRAMENPRQVIEEITGLPLPEKVRVSLFEEDA